jgi:hypothetical protein
MPGHWFVVIIVDHPLANGTAMKRSKFARQILPAILVLFAWSGVTLAESKTLSAIVSWQAQGQMSPAGEDKFRFQGDMEGIMYLETDEGPLNEAFIQCEIEQEVDTITESTLVNGECTIVVSTEDSVSAELTCRGVQGYCVGEFKLTGGTGRFLNISGSSEMTVRSPVHALAQNQSGNVELRVAAGIMQLPELTITLP